MKAPSDPPVFRSKNLLGVLSFLQRYRVGALFAVGLLLFNIAIEMTLPRVSRAAINDMDHALALGKFYELWKVTHGAIEMFLPREAGAEMNEVGNAIKTQTYVNPWKFAAIFLGLALVRALVGLALGRLRNRTIQNTLQDIRAAYFDAVQRLSFTYHDKTNTGELITRGTSDIMKLQDFLFACLFLGVDIAVATVSSVIMIFVISPPAGLAAFLTLVPTTVLITYYARRLHPRWRRVQDLHAEMTTVIQENIAGVRVVKAFAREDDEIAKFREQRDRFVNQVLETVNYWSGRVPMAQLIFGLSTPLVLWIGGEQIIAGKMRVGDLAAIVFYLSNISNRMGAVGQFVGTMQNASASSERVMEVLEEPLKMHGGTRRPAAKGGGQVTFENVSFQYPSGRAPALREISFAALAGQTVAIIGATGAGKSTLVHLIPRFYDPAAGVVRIDGIDVRELDLCELRRSVGMIFQETVLFSATVAENIAYGRSDATMAQIVAAARAAHAHEFILGLARGYQTVIGERGVSLSGGQKQRLAIARAFLLDPSILILDDATSSLDSKTERLIQEDMRRVCFGRTAFVIAHRLTTVQHADVILVLRDGRLVEQGTPADLLKSGGWFRELFRDQGHNLEGAPALEAPKP